VNVHRLATVACCVALTGCGGTFKDVGKPPELSPINGAQSEAVQFSEVSYPRKPARPLSSNSIWDNRQSALFTGRRTLASGDILTVLISINDKAQVRNQSDRSRTANRSLGLSGGYGVNGAGGDASLDLEGKSGTDFAGSGATVRSESIKLQIAATVSQVLPNGNLLIGGSQEVLVNSEMRVLTIRGIVRTTDIGPDNTVSYERIAEARISYGGKGRISEVQEPPYGQQIIDRVSPL
jgi:flagellar L-ring protein FlgH